MVASASPRSKTESYEPVANNEEAQAVGTCLPDPNGPSSIEWLEDHPWFCLDNCAEIEGGSGYGGCLYRQDPTIVADHGTCVDLFNLCEPEFHDGECEVNEGMSCTQADECVDECVATTNSGDFGFPESWVCDAQGGTGFGPGHCVPSPCENSASAYCELYR